MKKNNQGTVNYVLLEAVKQHPNTFDRVLHVTYTT